MQQLLSYIAIMLLPYLVAHTVEAKQRTLLWKASKKSFDSPTSLGTKEFFRLRQNIYFSALLYELVFLYDENIVFMYIWNCACTFIYILYLHIYFPAILKIHHFALYKLFSTILVNGITFNPNTHFTYCGCLNMKYICCIFA